MRTILNGVELGSGTVPSGSINSDEILDGSIVDADVNASAAIAHTKIASTGTSSATRFAVAANAYMEYNSGTTSIDFIIT